VRKGRFRARRLQWAYTSILLRHGQTGARSSVARRRTRCGGGERLARRPVGAALRGQPRARLPWCPSSPGNRRAGWRVSALPAVADRAMGRRRTPPADRVRPGAGRPADRAAHRAAGRARPGRTVLVALAERDDDPLVIGAGAARALHRARALRPGLTPLRHPRALRRDHRACRPLVHQLRRWWPGLRTRRAARNDVTPSRRRAPASWGAAGAIRPGGARPYATDAGGRYRYSRSLG
jgi:hypothetical protein